LTRTVAKGKVHEWNGALINVDRTILLDFTRDFFWLSKSKVEIETEERERRKEEERKREKVKVRLRE